MFPVFTFYQDGKQEGLLDILLKISPRDNMKKKDNNKDTGSRSKKVSQFGGTAVWKYAGGLTLESEAMIG